MHLQWGSVCYDFKTTPFTSPPSSCALHPAHPSLCYRCSSFFQCLSFLCTQTDKSGIDYKSGRNPSDFVDFFNAQSGTERVLGGGVTEVAGRIPALDEIAAEFIGASADRVALQARAAEVVASGDHPNMKEFSKFYLLAIKNILGGKTDYAANELARLEKMTASGSVTPKSAVAMQKRINIVKQFLAPAQEERDL